MAKRRVLCSETRSPAEFVALEQAVTVQVDTLATPVGLSVGNWALIAVLTVAFAPLPACLLFGVTFIGAISYLLIIPLSILQFESVAAFFRLIVGIPTGPILLWITLVCGLLIVLFRWGKRHHRLWPVLGALVLVGGIGWVAVYIQYPA